jgi:hypothetical protein
MVAKLLDDPEYLVDLDDREDSVTFQVTIFDNADHVTFVCDFGSHDEAVQTLTERGFQCPAIGARDLYVRRVQLIGDEVIPGARAELKQLQPSSPDRLLGGWK